MPTPERFPIVEPDRLHTDTMSAALRHLPEEWRDYEAAAESLGPLACQILASNSYDIAQDTLRPTSLVSLRKDYGIVYRSVLDFPLTSIRHTATMMHSFGGDILRDATFYLRSEDQRSADLAITTDESGRRHYTIKQAHRPEALEDADVLTIDSSAALDVLTDVALQAGADQDDNSATASIESISTGLVGLSPLAAVVKDGLYQRQDKHGNATSLQVTKTLTTQQSEVTARTIEVRLADQKAYGVDPAAVATTGLTVILHNPAALSQPAGLASRKPYAIEDSNAGIAQFMANVNRNRPESIKTTIQAAIAIPEGISTSLEDRNGLLNAALLQYPNNDAVVNTMRRYMDSMR